MEEESSWWKGIDKEQLQEAEDDILSHTGLNSGDIKSYPVEIELSPSDYLDQAGDKSIGEENRKEHVWTFEIGEKSSDKDTVVLIHGFGASSLFFYKLFKPLSERFHVMCIDLLGFGRSSRPEFDCEKNQEAEDFFVLSIERWREKLGLSNLTLICHSMGGYIGGRYALRYPGNVQSIFYLSPLGCDRIPDDIEKNFDNLGKTLSLVPRLGLRLMRYLPDKLTKVPPYLPLRLLGGFVSKKLIRIGTKSWVHKLPQEEADAVQNHVSQISLKKGSAENAIHVLFKYNFIPRHPLIEADALLEAKGIRTSYIYGDSDWLDFQHNGPKISQVLGDEGKNVHILSDSDHHLFFDNPDDLLKIIFEETI